MPSHRAVFLKPPESVCPPRASRGPGRGIPVRILDSGEISWTSATGDAATGRFSPISFPCHTSEIPPGGTLPFAPPRWFFASSLVTCYQIQVLCFQTLADSFAVVQNPTLLFSNDSGLFRKNTRGGGRRMTAPPILKPRVELRGRSSLAAFPDPKSSTTQCLRAAFLFLFSLFLVGPASFPQTSAPRAHLGFDRNDYPGDAALPILRKSFSFTSYWLSPPPGEKANTWNAKRELLRSLGFGFLLLYRGPQISELQQIWSESRFNRSDRLKAQAAKRGTGDARAAAAAAKKEGFPSHTVIFLDIEEGGRLPAVYHSYLRAWAGQLARANYRAGVYCSGMPVSEGRGATIITADDIRNNDGSRGLVYWVYNDACPPSPGCVVPQNPPPPSKSGIPYATVWQFAQSPRRKEFTSRCSTTYHADGNCYAPGDTARSWFLDINSADSTDPSHGK